VVPSRYAAFVSTAFAVALVLSPTGQASSHSIEDDALVAVMVDLATPVTGRPAVTIGCRPLAVNGFAAPWDNKIELDLGLCRKIGHAVYHQHQNAERLASSVPVLLHEAAHVAQYREGKLSDFSALSKWFEHDAECRALRALPRALRMLRYSRGMILAATRKFKNIVLDERAPYGGACA
jgi:hypothetical protein